jgi:hypothetical protein
MYNLSALTRGLVLVAARLSFALVLALTGSLPAAALESCATASDLQRAFFRWIKSVYDKHEDIEDWHPYSGCVESVPDGAVLPYIETSQKIRLTVGPLIPVNDPKALLSMLRELAGGLIEYSSPAAQAQFERLALRYLSEEPFQATSGSWRGDYVSGTFVVVIYRPGSRTVLTLRTGFYS